MTGYVEFLPWHTWKSLPENRDLTHDEALRKFNIERDAHLKKMLWYENQKKIHDAEK